MVTQRERISTSFSVPFTGSSLVRVNALDRAREDSRNSTVDHLGAPTH
jgi:hypothetical protein